MKNVRELNKAADEALKSAKSIVDVIVDSQSFVESDRFIRSATALGEATGEGVVSGFSTVGDVQVGVFAIAGDVLKGGIGQANAKKIAKCVKNAIKTVSPVVGIVDTQGARFAEGIEALEGYGEIFEAFSSAYGVVPTILVVKGSNYGMTSYLSSLCDFTVCYDKSVTATSSPLILVAGTTADAAKVGTGEAMAKAGVASVVVKSDKELADVVKKLISFMTFTAIETEDDGNRVCKGLKTGTKTAAVISEIFDKDSFLEIKKGFGAEVVTGYARLNGVAVGVVASDATVNDGILTPDGAKKVAELVNTCDYFAVPVVSLIDSKGVVNCAACQGELMRSVGDMIYAYATASVAKVALVTGNAIGVGYTAFCSKSVSDYTIAWESACIGMLDNAASAELVYAKEIAEAKDKDAALIKLAKEYGDENTAAVTVAEKGYIDNVINPNFSRQYLIAAVQSFIEKR